MTITYPRPFPAGGRLRRRDVELMRFQSESITGGGIPASTDMAPALWVGNYETPPLSQRDFAQWEAWIASLDGGLRLFRGEGRRSYPVAYANGFSSIVVPDGTAFSGVTTVTSVAGDLSAFSVSNLPRLFLITAGDFVSVATPSRTALHVVTESVAATATGNATISVSPAVRPDVAVGAAVTFVRPWCEMRLKGKPEISGPPGGPRVVKFSGIQVVI